MFLLSDGVERVITESSNQLPDGFLTDLQNTLDTKVDKVANKQLSTEDFANY